MKGNSMKGTTTQSNITPRLRPHDPSLSQSRPRFGCFAGTFSPSCRQIRSTRLSLTTQPASLRRTDQRVERGGQPPVMLSTPLANQFVASLVLDGIAVDGQDLRLSSSRSNAASGRAVEPLHLPGQLAIASQEVGIVIDVLCHLQRNNGQRRRRPCHPPSATLRLHRSCLL